MKKNLIAVIVDALMFLTGIFCSIAKFIIPGYMDAKGMVFVGIELIILSIILFAVLCIKGNDAGEKESRSESRPTVSRRNNFSYFKNNECECFPCHKTEGDFFNCMFCYCPLYTLGDKCGGNFEYIKDGIKDCSKCSLPHTKDGYLQIMLKVRKLSEMAKKGPDSAE